MENAETKLKPGTAEYETDVIKRARKAATTIGKTLEHYRLIGEALSIMRKRAMKEAGLEGSNKPPAGPKYAKALDAELDKAPEFLAPEVFESGSARTHAIWLHDYKADVDWTLQVAERAKPGSTRRWNNPTYIWKQWRRLVAEPSKKALEAKASKEAKAKAQADELERYRNEWKVKYEAVKAELDALRFDANPDAASPYRNATADESATYHKAKVRAQRKRKGYNVDGELVELPGGTVLKRKRKAKEPEPGGFAPGVKETIASESA